MGERVAPWFVGRGAWVRGALAALAGVLVTSCALDSRWFEQKRLQEAAVKHATPKELERAGRGDGSPAALRVMRISAHATPRYSAEVVEWTRSECAQLMILSGVRKKK